jgi:hypothetical protein
LEKMEKLTFAPKQKKILVLMADRRFNSPLQRPEKFSSPPRSRL